MDIQLIRKVVSDMAPLGLKEIIPTTMGEPLQYKAFPEIIELCKEFKLKLNLTTNGSFYSRGLEAWSRMIVPVASDVKFSWNGATEDTQRNVMKGSTLVTQIKNLKRFIAIRDEIAEQGGNRCSVTRQLTFMEVNLTEIPAIVAMAVENGLDRVKGHHLWAHFDEIADQTLRRSNEYITVECHC
jgi:MoaA/NifB/PqqE/SkfB family radical SAM enzyme